MSKYDLVASVIARSGARDVLDVGCRDGILGRVLEGQSAGVSYTGLDMQDGPAVDVVCDVTQGLPFGDGSFDAVTAVDVLEHVDDLQAGLNEVVRVARRTVVVVLPNMAHFLHRARYVTTGRLSAKYDLAIDYGKDRHRWLTLLPQTDSFMREYAGRCGATLQMHPVGSGGRRSTHIERLLARTPAAPAWYVYAACYEMTLPGE